MGVGSGVQGGRGSPWIFMHGTDKVEGGLFMLFFGLVFSVSPLPLEMFLPTPLGTNLWSTVATALEQQLIF